MADNKKYYYMKLKDNFFDSDEMIVLESMTDGYLYTNILMKLYLRSLKDNGCLMFKGVIPYTPDVLSKVVRHNVGVVEKAIDIFKKFGLVEILDNGAIYMMDIQNFIGESSSEADRKRLYRSKIETEKLTLGHLSGHMSDECTDKTTPELEIDLELDLERKTTTTAIAYSETILDVHYKIFGNYGMSTLMSQFVTELLNRGYTEVFIKEVMYEAGESSGGKPNIKYLKTISERWIKEKIYTRIEAQRQRVVPIQPKNQSYPIAVGQAISNIDETNDILAEMERLKEVKRQRLAAQKGEST